ncbi:hypothetical protein ES695_00890 [Candidatus Atribacteria bacterium 1244-E10-H5-B2]|nr:MAG: hypothetical protein ES695_00695 [Candidatus Atribacteria bacterium 1244-E10-H5-B2]RXG66925.1 MAG: hypothetical protein ES695_00890 [Candidatus Atribacteria bacterium 1244-E10-H5-B2]
MPKYRCKRCKAVFYGWAVRGKCPSCGGELKEVYSDNKADNKKFRRDPIAKILKTQENLRSGNL